MGKKNWRLFKVENWRLGAKAFATSIIAGIPMSIFFLLAGWLATKGLLAISVLLYLASLVIYIPLWGLIGRNILKIKG